MKKIVVKLFFVLVIISSVFGITSCGDDGGMVSYSEAGLNFKLPKNMEKLEVNWADSCFGDRNNVKENAQFFTYYYSRDALLTDLYLDKDVTVSEYADWFKNANGYTDVQKTVNEAGNTATLKYEYHEDGENLFFVDYIIRNEAVLAHVTMCCNAEYREKYDPIFAEWITYISLAG